MKIRLVLAALALAAALPVHAQSSWPDKPIHFIVPFSPGGANDQLGRAAAEAVSKQLGQPVIVENKPGAGAIIGAEYVAKAKPDGYTFLVGAVGVVTNSIIRTKMPYQDSDLVPVGLIALAPSVIVAAPSAPVSNLKELVEYSKKQNGIPFATAGTGSTPHFVEEMLKQTAGANLIVVPYKSGSEGVTAVLSNQVIATSEASTVVLPHIKAGKLKAIAATWDKRMTADPSIPTAAEQGFPDVLIAHWAGLFAPKGTPQAIVDKMNAALNAGVQTKDFRDRLIPQGIEPGGGSVQSFQQFIERERTRLGKVARAAKMQED